MKKTIAMIAVAALAVSASADLTGFDMAGGVAYDSTGTAFASNAANVYTLLNKDLGASVSGDTIDISFIKGVGASDIFSSIGLAVAPARFGGTYSFSAQGTGAAAGSTAYFVVTTAASWDSIAVGDYIGIITESFTLNDLQLDPAAPPLTSQQFTGSNVTANVQVIPEPATVGLLGVAGLGLFLARRKARS